MVVTLETRKYEFWGKTALCKLYINLVLSSFVPALCQLCASLCIVPAYALRHLTHCILPSNDNFSEKLVTIYNEWPINKENKNCVPTKGIMQLHNTTYTLSLIVFWYFCVSYFYWTLQILNDIMIIKKIWFQRSSFK